MSERDSEAKSSRRVCWMPTISKGSSRASGYVLRSPSMSFRQFAAAARALSARIASQLASGSLLRLKTAAIRFSWSSWPTRRFIALNGAGAIASAGIARLPQLRKYVCGRALKDAHFERYDPERSRRPEGHVDQNLRNLIRTYPVG